VNVKANSSFLHREDIVGVEIKVCSHLPSGWDTPFEVVIQIVNELL
jgi:hypothetical protein